MASQGRTLRPDLATLSAGDLRYFLPRLAKQQQQQQVNTVFANPTTPTAAHVIMVTSPPASFPIDEKTTQISSWLEQVPPTPAEDEERWLLKRKRATSEPTSVHQFSFMSAHRSVSPSKRQRRDSDDLRPEQSASAVGSNARPLILGSSTTFSPPDTRVSASTSRRSNSPSRETIAGLRVAFPPITTEPLDGVESEPPARVMAVVARLENGLDQGWIPGWLEVRINAYPPNITTKSG
jgi:hypothetical protein